MTSTPKVGLKPRHLSSDRFNAEHSAVENSRVVIAAALFALLLLGEAMLFVHAVRTIPDFLSYLDYAAL